MKFNSIIAKLFLSLFVIGTATPFYGQTVQKGTLHLNYSDAEKNQILQILGSNGISYEEQANVITTNIPRLCQRLENVYSVECIDCRLDSILDSLNQQFPLLDGSLDEIAKVNSSHFPNDYTKTYGAFWGRWNLDMIKAPEAWDITKGNRNVRIAILDGGFDITHEEFKYADGTSKIAYCKNNDCDIVQWNGIEDTHGTRVAGIAAGSTDNNLGFSSIGYNSSFMFYRSCLFGFCPNGYIDIEAAANDGADVINCSWSGCGLLASNSAQMKIVETATNLGVVVVASAGNGTKSELCSGGCNVGAGLTKNGLRSPASIPSVISVSSVTPDDLYEGGETHSYNSGVDITAPGHGVPYIADMATNGGYGPETGSFGTSEAAPHVSGTVALMLDVNPRLSPSEIQTLLKQSADNINSKGNNASYAGCAGSGRLNAFEAVKAARDFIIPSRTVHTGEDYFIAQDRYQSHDITVLNGGTLHIIGSSMVTLNRAGGQNIIVENGGKLIIGDRSVLNIHEGGLVHIKPGAELIYQNTDPLEGFVVGVSNAFRTGSTAELRIEGTLKVEDNAVLTNHGNGFMSFYNNGKLEFGNNCGVNIKRSQRNTKFLHLGNNVALNLEGENIRISDGIIAMGTNAEINFNKFKRASGVRSTSIISNIDINGSFTARNNKINLYQTDQTSLSNCRLSNMKTGLNLINPKGWVVVSHGNFTGCETGLQISGAIDPTNKIQNSTFNNCTVGMNLLGCPAITTSLAEFENCATGIKTNGTTYLYLENRTKVRNGNIGVKADLTNVFVRETSQISGNNIGVEMINSPVKPKIFSMGDDGTCGWLTNNGVGLAGKNIALDVDAIDRDPTTTNFIPNHFEGNGVMFNYLLEAAGGITSLPKISMKGNYWGSPTIVGSINNPIYKAYIPNHQIQIYYESAIGQILRYNVDDSSPCARGSSNCTICNDLIAAPPGGGGRPNITPIEQILSSCYKTDQPGGGNGNGETIKEEFNRGYNKFLAKDYDAAIPMLEEVAEIPFRERQPRLNDHCEHLILIAEILTEKFTNGDVVGNLTSNPYKLEINPNPVHGNFVANFDMLDKANGKLVIKDAITGLEVQSESLANASGSKQININGLQSGNYILELHGNNQFLKSQHLMVY